MTNGLRGLAQDGILRVAINTGNRALVQTNETGLTGISPALAVRLAAEIEADLETITYEGAGKVFADATSGRWDVAFLAMDEKRAQRVAFTRPYVTIEATYAVRAGSEMLDVNDVDKNGVHVLTSTGSAYDMHLTAALQNAVLERSGTPPESFEEFQNGRCDAVAGVRASLEAAFADDPDIRILPSVLTAVYQAMVLPGADNAMIGALDDFVARAIEDGSVASILQTPTD